MQEWLHTVREELVEHIFNLNSTSAFSESACSAQDKAVEGVALWRSGPRRRRSRCGVLLGQKREQQLRREFW